MAEPNIRYIISVALGTQQLLDISIRNIPICKITGTLIPGHAQMVLSLIIIAASWKTEKLKLPQPRNLDCPMNRVKYVTYRMIPICH